MPEKEVRLSAEFSQGADFFMVIGSTLLVHPAAGMPGLAKKNNAFLAMVNMSETPYDNLFDVIIFEKAGKALCLRRIGQPLTLRLAGQYPGARK